MRHFSGHLDPVDNSHSKKYSHAAHIALLFLAFLADSLWSISTLRSKNEQVDIEKPIETFLSHNHCILNNISIECIKKHPGNITFLVHTYKQSLFPDSQTNKQNNIMYFF